MLIGLTYDLRIEYLAMGFSEEETAEFDSVGTIDSLSGAISRLGHETDRIGNIQALAKRLVSGDRWDLVFNICEGMYGRSREAQIPALLEAYNIPYTFSDPLTMAVSLDKAATKQILIPDGIPAANFLLIRDADELKEYEFLNYPLFVKPAFEGTGKGIDSGSLVSTFEALYSRCKKVIETCSQPVLVEQYLPGREFTVGILGTGKNARAIGVLEVKLNRGAEPNAYSYKNKELCEELVTYELVTDRKVIEEASEIALAAYVALDCRDAGRVDLKEDSKGRLNFLEINPLAGLNPTHSDLPILCTKVGIPYIELISGIIESAMLRSRQNNVKGLKGI